MLSIHVDSGFFVNNIDMRYVKEEAQLPDK